ncbi:MAG: xanthine dehydrogenase family protein molybdopterin-binding subunit [Chloroflexi bacterium]|nr:xanthine dehydrogenase family protein molybdopterin-binding subunit [Chloroflexota bacterium]
MCSYSVVGKGISRVDVMEKATGAAQYTFDIRLPGMLYGKVLRSPYAHARIVHIDTSRAEHLKGVKALICGRDIPPRGLFHLGDQTLLATDKVRFVGEPVAAVAATDRDTADEALDLIEVDYEELPPLFDPEEAMAEGALLIHEKLGEYHRLMPWLHPIPGTNICHLTKLRRGDVEAGFREAYRVYENRFTTSMVQHCSLEPHVAVAAVGATGDITLYASTQSPFLVRERLSHVFQIPISKMRVIVPYVGGGFGAKSAVTTVEPIAVGLALKAQAPVKLQLDRSEEFTSTVVRHPTVINLKTGVSRDGKLLASKAKVIWDTGAYADDGPFVARWGGLTASGPYQIENVWNDSCCVYTNKAVAGAFRGFGCSQITWAHESQMDIIARDLGIDPLEIRLKNAVEEGATAAWGEKLHSVGLKASLRAAAEAIGWGKKLPPGTGMGIACMHKFTVALMSSAMVKVNDDGRVEVFKGSIEMGQGNNTIVTQIASEVIGVPVEQISVPEIDTRFSPYNGGTFGSRDTFMVGNAVRLAAEDARRQLLKAAAEMLKVPFEELRCEGGRVFSSENPAEGVYLAEIAYYSNASPAGPIIGKSGYSLKGIPFRGIPLDPETGQSERPAACWTYAAQAAEVTVDKDTGTVRILKLVAAHDVGRAINPTNCEQQIEGALVMGIGTTLYEELGLDAGRIVNPSFADYKVPRASDVPELVPIIIEAPHRDGPFGAKGVGEPGLAPTAAAIGNAICATTSVRLKDLPITPEKIFSEMKEREA